MMHALKFLQNLFCAAALLLFISAQAPADAQDEVDEATLAAAVELVDAAGAIKMLETVMPLISQQLIGAIVQVKPELKGKYDVFITEFLDTALGEGRDEILGAIAVIYARNFTIDEIKDITAFYKTPTGRKVVQMLPEIQAESAKIGQAWGTKVARRTLERLRSKLKEDGHEF